MHYEIVRVLQMHINHADPLSQPTGRFSSEIGTTFVSPVQSTSLPARAKNQGYGLDRICFVDTLLCRCTHRRSPVNKPDPILPSSCLLCLLGKSIYTRYASMRSASGVAYQNHKSTTVSIIYSTSSHYSRQDKTVCSTD